MTFPAAIQNNVAQQICCTGCNRALAQVVVLPGIVATDVDGLVLERRVSVDRRWVIFGPGWRPASPDLWKYDDAARPDDPVHSAGLAHAFRDAMRQARASLRDEVCPLTDAIKAICPQCACANTIQMEETE